MLDKVENVFEVAHSFLPECSAWQIIAAVS